MNNKLAWDKNTPARATWGIILFFLFIFCAINITADDDDYGHNERYGERGYYKDRGRDGNYGNNRHDDDDYYSDRNRGNYYLRENRNENYNGGYNYQYNENNSRNWNSNRYFDDSQNRNDGRRYND